MRVPRVYRYIASVSGWLGCTDVYGVDGPVLTVNVVLATRTRGYWTQYPGISSARAPYAWALSYLSFFPRAPSERVWGRWSAVRRVASAAPGLSSARERWDGHEHREDTPPKSLLSLSLTHTPVFALRHCCALPLSPTLPLSLCGCTLLFGCSRGFDLYFRGFGALSPLREPPLKNPLWRLPLPCAPGQLLRAVLIIIRLLLPTFEGWLSFYWVSRAFCYPIILR